MGPSAMYLPCDHEDLSLIIRTHRKSCLWQSTIVNPVLEMGRALEFVSKLQASERHCLQMKMNGTSEEWQLSLSSCLHRHAHACVWTHTDMHTHTHGIKEEMTFGLCFIARIRYIRLLEGGSTGQAETQETGHKLKGRLLTFWFYNKQTSRR